MLMKAGIQIQDSGEKNMKKVTPWTIIRAVIIVVLIGVIAYEAVMIYRDQKEYSVAVNEYDDIRDNYVNTSADNDDKESQEGASLWEDTYPKLDINFSALSEINSDFIGWLYFPALSKINYPVVKEQTIDQYLYKTFEGTPNRAGCIFMDVLSNENFEGPSDMVFGHNMKNGSMFGTLKSLYKSDNKDILKDNPYVYIYTEDKVYKYRVFGYYTTTQGSYSYTEVTDESVYDEYIKFIKNNSIIDVPEDIRFDEYPPLLTLSTCSGQTGSGRRFVVHTIKVETFER